MKNKAFEEEWARTPNYGPHERPFLKIVAQNFFEAGQRQMNERCANAVVNVDPSEYGMRGGAVKNACLEAVKETKP